MNKIIILIKIFIVILLFSSCESVLTDVDLPETKPMYVLTTYLSPEDSIIKIKLSLSKPMFNNQNTNNNDSTFLNGSMRINGVDVLRVPGENYFKLSQDIFPILAGHSYTVTYDAPDGTKLIGTCEVPNNINTSLSYKWDSIVEVDEFGNNSTNYYVNYEFTDSQELGDNYQLFWLEVQEGNGFTNTEILGFFDDKSNNGNVRNGKKDVYMYDTTYSKVHRYLVLFTCDKNYYNYNKAVYTQNEIGDFPFSEPVIIPTNVENGLGCVGAYRKFTKIVKK